MTNSEVKDTIMSRRKVSLRDDYTVDERGLVKEWANKAEQKNKEEITEG